MEAGKTGVLYDPLTLLHCCSRYHPERPQRVESIIAHLQQKNYLKHPRVDFVEKLKEAPLELIGLVHSKKYIDNVNKLLGEGNARSHIMVLDTYYNKHSRAASQLAVGGVIEGLDNIQTGKWRNAFAIVRPPGHHSGARNTINGFCVYNNVAIGIQYLRTKYNINRIAVFDWDVHHGDGTQHLFKEDPNLLFISLHRHDRGSFYPGDSGSHTNVGNGPAEGKQINIPWNTTNQKYQSYDLTPGDNEYIYIFERALHPILKEFKPEFIFISAGFDSARGDPLGGMSVGPEGYHYLTKKLMKIAPLIVVLEGGYNLKSISWAAESVMAALVDEQGPRQSSFNDYELKEKCWLPDYYHSNLDTVLGTIKKYWPVVSTKKYEDYEKAIKSNPKRVFGKKKSQEDEEQSSSTSSEEEKEVKSPTSPLKEKEKENPSPKPFMTADPPLEEKLKTIREVIPFSQETSEMMKTNPVAPYHKKLPTETGYYLASGHVLNFRFDGERIIKTVKDTKQLEFYRSNFPERQFAPKFISFEGSDIILQNLLYGVEEPNVVDIKIGKTDANSKLSEAKLKKQEKKSEISSTGKYGFRIVGLVTPQLKEYGLLFKDEELIRKVLRKVVDQHNRQEILSFINKLQETLKQNKRVYYSTSLLIIRSKDKTAIRWIDFTYWHESDDYDRNLVWGLNNLAQFIQQLTF